MHLGVTEVAGKETQKVQKVANRCVSAQRSVPRQITCLSERQGVLWLYGALLVLLVQQDACADCPSGRAACVSTVMV